VYFAEGHVFYAKEHLEQLGLDTATRSHGDIIWVKPSMWKGGSIPADVQQYFAAHSEFPQQTTADQWFDEAQFESYRRLGECAGDAMERSLLNLLNRPVAVPEEDGSRAAAGVQGSEESELILAS
jgi:hypothetical protein